MREGGRWFTCVREGEGLHVCVCERERERESKPPVGRRPFDSSHGDEGEQVLVAAGAVEALVSVLDPASLAQHAEASSWAHAAAMSSPRGGKGPADAAAMASAQVLPGPAAAAPATLPPSEGLINLSSTGGGGGDNVAAVGRTGEEQEPGGFSTVGHGSAAQRTAAAAAALLNLSFHTEARYAPSLLSRSRLAAHSSSSHSSTCPLTLTPAAHPSSTSPFSMRPAAAAALLTYPFTLRPGMLHLFFSP